MLNYNHLHYFHVAACEGSVAGAAERLGVTQPTVSEQLRALERALDVVLFERMPTGLRLTDAGRLAFEHTSVMFRAGERLVESLRPDAPELPRSLRIGVSTVVARVTPPDFLVPLLAVEDCVPIVQTGDSVELVRALHGSEIDLALCESEPPDAARRGLEVVEIENTTLVVVAPPGVRPGDGWQDVGIARHKQSSSLRWEVDEYLSANKLAPRVIAEADDSTFLVEAATRMGLVAIVPRAVARQRIANRQLNVLAVLPASQLGVFALFHDRIASQLARRAVEVLVEHVRCANGLAEATIKV
jgi:LysR family transcriptional activator of nhaA